MSLVNSRTMNPQTRDLVGSQFGLWSVESFAGYARKGRASNAEWRCVCACGAIRVVRACNLLSNKSRACVTCANSSLIYDSGSKVRTMGVVPAAGIPVAKWTAVCTSARNRNIEVVITPDEAYDIFLKQDGCCALSGIPITLKTTGTGSLDRIDSKLSYIPGNVQWVHKHVNRMKNIYSQEYFIDICKKIAARVEKK